MPDLSDLVVLGARVTYMIAQDNATGRPVALGERPDCAMWTLLPGADQCVAEMVITNESDGESVSERCTRETRHRGPHVVHAAPGLPVLAWLETAPKGSGTS